MEHAGELDTDHSSTHTDDAFRNLGQVPAGVAIGQIAPVNARKGRDERDGTGGQDDLVRVKLLWRAPAAGHGDGAGGVDRSQAIKDLNVIALHQYSHTARHALDDFLSKGDYLAHV